MVLCNLCNNPFSIKDNDVYSSMLCRCRIILYYYDLGNNVEIKREEFIPGYKGGKDAKHDQRTS